MNVEAMQPKGEPAAHLRPDGDDDEAARRQRRRMVEPAKPDSARPLSNPGPITVPVPSHAAWFRLDGVHEIERRALPEFFDGGSQLKTAETYVQMRNFIVQTYREQPALHLSVTECRRNLAVDVAAVMRMHQFLVTAEGFELDPSRPIWKSGAHMDPSTT